LYVHELVPCVNSTVTFFIVPGPDHPNTYSKSRMSYMRCESKREGESTTSTVDNKLMFCHETMNRWREHK
jgi:hypothetical protein